MTCPLYQKILFSKTPPSPLWLRRSPSRSAMIKYICHCSRLIRTFPLKRGSTSLLNPLPPQEGKDLKPGRLSLYEQTSSRPQGVARELLTQQKVNFVDSRLRSAEHSSELDALLSLARELRVFMRRGRGCAFWGGK